MTEIAGLTKPPSLRAVLEGLRRAGLRSASSGTHAGRRGPVVRDLGRLGPAWRVLDDVAAGRRGRIEHLVIGPGGVFAVTARHDARNTICLGGDRLLVDGNRIHHGRLSREDAAEVSARLTESVGFSVPVTALVLIVGDRRFLVPDQPDDSVVRVTTPAAGARWIRRSRAELTAQAVERVYAAACDAKTWSRQRPVPGVERQPRQSAVGGSREAG
jgi:hypothetical protein